MKRFLLLTGLFVLNLVSAERARPDPMIDSLLKSLPWRSIGPAVTGGRVDDFAVVESDPSTYYVATAAGGVFKTVNHGTTFEPVFDSQSCLSIGDITVAPSDPNVVWVGSGEANNRQSSSWGCGVYKSIDAGKTWTHMGLPESRHIGRIVIDPRNPDLVYVAAGGDLWAASEERGVYQTLDGGKTWTRSLFIDSDTGCSDLAIDPIDPSIIYAAAYQRRRTPAGFNGGGAGSGIYKTSDGGKHWNRMTRGLPGGDNGRIGIDVYRKNPAVVYACVENADGGIFRSDDKGETWKKMGAVSMGLNAFRPMYFSQIRVDPNNDQNVVMAGVSIGWSGDGGKTFETFGGARIHPDTHAIWIDPANSRHILVGCDGGVQTTFDQGKSWDFHNTLPIAQFYEVAYDMRKPYWVYGGLQDNGSWGAPNMSLTGRGVTNADWVNVGGGDGFYCQADPVDANTVYSESQQGSISRLNVSTGERKSVRPVREAGEAYRFDWNTPILISPHNHNRIYLGGNRLFISDDRGDSWRSTQDLTTNPDRTKIPIMGVMPTPKTLALNDGQESFGEIVTLSESPTQADVLWIGTDDGNVQVSRDDGRSWRNVAERLPASPHGTYVTRVLASAFAPGRAYVALDGHRTADYKPYLFLTEDFGETWRQITNGISLHHTVKAIREHPRNPSLLFVGTERGAFVSMDRGDMWTEFGPPLSSVPVNDIQVQPRENDLILATHGRGMYILDDIAPFEQLADRAFTGSFLLCDPRPAVEYRTSFSQSWIGNRVFTGDNPPPGASIQYYVRTQSTPTTTARIVITDRSGTQVVSEYLGLSAEPGLHRFRWDMRYRGRASTEVQDTGAVSSSTIGSDFAVNDDEEDGAHLVRRMSRQRYFTCQTPDATPSTASAERRTPGPRQTPGGRGTGFGPRLLPGVYRVRLSIGDEEQMKEIRVEDDPRVRISDHDRRALYELQLRLMNLSQLYGDARRVMTTLRTELASMQKAADAVTSAPEVRQALSDLESKLRSTQTVVAEGRLSTGSRTAEPGTASESGQPQPAAQAGIVLSRLNSLISSANGITEPISKSLRHEADLLTDTLRHVVTAVNSLNYVQVVRVNKTLEAHKLKELPLAAAIARPR